MAELDPDRIAAAALAVATKHGAGFTMRAVADALGVTPMALYHHVRGKAALAALLIDVAIRKHPLPPPTGQWQDDLCAMARWTRQTMTTHPVIARLRREYQVWTPSMLRMTERWLSLWQQSGLDLDKAVLAATTSSMAVAGLAAEALIFEGMQPPDDALLSMLPNVRFMFSADHDLDAEFDLVVRALIEGLHARLASAPSMRSTAARDRAPRQRKPGRRSRTGRP